MRQRTGTAAAAAVVARVAAVGVVVLLGVAGCGSGSSGGSGLPTVTGPTGPATTTATTDAATAGSSTAAPSGASPDRSPWTALPTISSGPNQGVHNGVVLASSSAKTADEKAAVDAFVAFWTFAAAAGYDGRLDVPELNKLAQGAAAENVVKYVQGLREKRARTIGWVSINVTRVGVTPVNATLKGSSMDVCFDNGTIDVGATSGKPLEDPFVAFTASVGLRSTNGSWRVSFVSTTRQPQTCD